MPRSFFLSRAKANPHKPLPINWLIRKFTGDVIGCFSYSGTKVRWRIFSLSEKKMAFIPYYNGTGYVYVEVTGGEGHALQWDSKKRNRVFTIYTSPSTFRTTRNDKLNCFIFAFFFLLIFNFCGFSIFWYDIRAKLKCFEFQYVFVINDIWMEKHVL